MSSHGGVVFRVAAETWFLPATIAIKVLPAPEVAKVPGGPPELRGVALVDGMMIPVVDVLDAPGAALPGSAMLVCAVVGESVGIVGIEIVATGRFEAADHTEMAVRLNGEVARTFDVAAVISRIREGRWVV